MEEAEDQGLPVILHVWRENTMIYQTNKIGNFVFAYKDLFPLGK